MGIREFFGLKSREAMGVAEQVIPSRVQNLRTGSIRVDAESALRHSGVWASQRLRANLVSSLPVDVFRTVGGISVDVAKPPVLISPDGEQDIADWLWATQFDLDRFGNTIGIITLTDAFGLPARIELQPMNMVKVISEGPRVTGYRIDGKRYEPSEVWHERQYRPAGFPVGLSPLAYAAWSIGGYLSAQQFGLDYFGAGGMPSGVLRNTDKVVNDPRATDEIKSRFKASTANRDIFVTGKDWEWTPAHSEGAAMAFLEDKRYGLGDVARYFDVPSDLIDAAMSSSSVTYANITSRMVQLLVTSLGPTIGRRERALSKWTPKPRTVKLNSDALLRMDPETRARVILSRVAGRTLAPSEARSFDDLPPFTEEQMVEIDRLLPAKIVQPKVETVA